MSEAVTVRRPDGALVVVCRGRTQSRPTCEVCGRVARTLCDGPQPGGGSCDRALCTKHAHRVASDRHLCSACYQLARPALGLGAR